MTVNEALELAEELDNMERDVTTWEADFLESILKRLREDGSELTPKQEYQLRRMEEKYLAGGDDIERVPYDSED